MAISLLLCFDSAVVIIFLHVILINAEAVTQMSSVKKVFLEISQNSQENTCAKVSFLRPQGCNFFKKETLTQVFSYEFFEIIKNSFFTEHLLEMSTLYFCIVATKVFDSLLVS